VDEVQVTERTSLASRVRAGVAFLDENKPGWHEYVIPYALNMASGCDCVLGQVYGDFYVAQDALFGDDFEAQTVRLGFDTAEVGIASLRQFETLRRIWSYVVRTRQAVAQ
jgi:hypothetical protein